MMSKKKQYTVWMGETGTCLSQMGQKEFQSWDEAYKEVRNLYEQLKTICIQQQVDADLRLRRGNDIENGTVGRETLFTIRDENKIFSTISARIRSRWVEQDVEEEIIESPDKKSKLCLIDCTTGSDKPERKDVDLNKDPSALSVALSYCDPQPWRICLELSNEEALKLETRGYLSVSMIRLSIREHSTNRLVADMADEPVEYPSACFRALSDVTKLVCVDGFGKRLENLRLDWRNEILLWNYETQEMLPEEPKWFLTVAALAEKIQTGPRQV